MKKRENWFSRHKTITILIVIIAAIIVYRLAAGTGSTGSSAYTEVQPSRRDITTYNSFTGNITPVTQYNVTPGVSASVKEVLVEKGDQVTEGQVLLKLDSSSQEDAIALQQAQLNAARKSNALQIESAQNQLDNFNNGVVNGWNSTLNSAWNAQTNAESSLSQAEENLEEAQNNKTDAVNQANDALANAKKALDQASAQLTALTSSSDYLSMNQDVSAKQTLLESAQAEEKKAQLELSQAQDAYDDAVKAAADLTEVQSALEKAQAAYDTAKIHTIEAQDNYANAQDSLNNYTSEAQNAFSTAQSAYEQAKNAVNSANSTDLSQLEQAVDSAKTAYEQAKQSSKSAAESAAEQQQSLATALQQAQAAADTSYQNLQISQAEKSLEDYTITAPISGTVTAINVEEGDMTTMTTPAVVISDLSKMKVEIKVDEYSVANMKKGSPVTIYIDSMNASYPGTVTYVDAVAANTNGVAYFNAEVQFDADENIHAGISVEVRLVTTDEKDVLAVPSAAVQYHADNTAYVLVKEGNGQAEKDVEIGASDGNYVEIKSGLDETDTVLYTITASYPLQQAAESNSEDSND